MALVEACVSSVAEAIACCEAGAQRLELCTQLECDGLTPPAALLAAVKAAVPIPVMVLLRPAPHDVALGADDRAAILNSLAEARELGADGFVLGALTDALQPDEAFLASCVEAAEGKALTFHRAFDQVQDPLIALESLARLGIHRILTSGGPGRAWANRHRLHELMVASAGIADAPEIMLGGQVRGDHVVELLRATGAQEVHARAAAIPALLDALRGA